MRCAFSWITCPAPALQCHTGGDIACAVEAPGAVRLLIGDVMGHGAQAARTAAEVTRAFGRLAACQEPLAALATRLHAFVAGRDGGEEFVTALLVSVPTDDDTDDDDPAAAGADAVAEIVCCGHPQPLLLRDGRATPLDTLPPALPLGLLDMAGCPLRAGPLGAGPGDSVLLYTDGVTDARDAAGVTYPLAERAAALAGARPPLLQALRADLLDYTGGKLRDDATLLHLRLTGAPADAAAGAAGLATGAWGWRHRRRARRARRATSAL